MLTRTGGEGGPFAHQLAEHFLRSRRKNIIKACPDADVAAEIDRAPASELANKTERSVGTVVQAGVGQTIREPCFDKRSKPVESVLNVIVPSEVRTASAHSVSRTASWRSGCERRRVIRRVAIRPKIHIKMNVAGAVQRRGGVFARLAWSCCATGRSRGNERERNAHSNAPMLVEVVAYTGIEIEHTLLRVGATVEFY